MRHSTVKTLAAALTLSVAMPASVALIALPRPALAQSVVTVDNLTIEGQKFSLRIPRLTLEGSSNTQADIRALFDSNSSEPWSARFAKISARSISLPIVEIVHTLQTDIKSTTTYRDSVISDVRSGVIGEIITPLTTGTSDATSKTASPRKGDVTVLNSSIKALDLPQIMRFLFEAGQPGEPLKTVMGESNMGKFTMDSGPEGTFTLAGLRSSDYKLRSTPTPALAAFRELESLSKTKSRENDRRAAELGLMLASSVSIGNFEMLGLAGDFKPKVGQAAKMNIDRMAMAGGADVPGRFALQGFGIETTDGKVKVRDISLDGLNFSGVMTALGRASASGNKTEDINPAELIPRIDLVRVAGVDIDVPDAKDKNQRITAKMGLLEVKMGNHVGSIPANFALMLDQLLLQIPPGTKDTNFKEMIALGYSRIDLSARYDQVWNEQAKTLSLKDLTFRSAQMFTSNITAELGNVSRDLFTGDKALAAVAALSVIATKMNVTLTNEGLFDKLITQQAKQQGRKPEDLRAEIAAGAALGIPMMMAGHPGAKALAEAVGRFVAKPGVLKVGVTSKDGIGAADVIGTQNPLDVLKKVDIDATAN